MSQHLAVFEVFLNDLLKVKVLFVDVTEKIYVHPIEHFFRRSICLSDEVFENVDGLRVQKYGLYIHDGESILFTHLNFLFEWDSDEVFGFYLVNQFLINTNYW